MRNILKDLRKESNKTQLEVANYLNIKQSSYAYYEKTDLIKISLSTLYKLSRLYNLTMDEFVQRAMEESDYNEDISTVSFYYRGKGKMEYKIPEEKKELVDKVLKEFSEE